MASRIAGPLLEADTAIVVAGGAAIVVAGGALMGLASLDQQAHKPVWASVWFDIGFPVLIIGLLLVIVSLYCYFYGKKRKKSVPNDETVSAVPGSLTLGNVRITDDSNLNIDSSAERFADGTTIDGRARVMGRHFPGHPGDFIQGRE